MKGMGSVRIACVCVACAGFLVAPGLAAAQAGATQASAPIPDEAAIGPTLPTGDLPIYEVGFDFAAALASHIIVESAIVAFDRAATFSDSGQAASARRSVLNMDVFTLAFPAFADFELTGTETDAEALRKLKARWIGMNGRTPRFDLGPGDGVGARALGLVIEYADTSLLPKLAALRAAPDLSATELQAEAVFMNFMGMATFVWLQGADSPSGFTLLASLAEKEELERALRQTRREAEGVRQLMVASRSRALSAEQEAAFRLNLDRFEDALQSFIDELRVSLSHHS